MFDPFFSEMGMTREEFARLLEKERREKEEKKRAELEKWLRYNPTKRAE